MRSLLALLLLALATGARSKAAAGSLNLRVLTLQLPVSGNGWLQVEVTDAATGKLAPRETKVVMESLKTATGAVSISPDVRLWWNDDGTFGADLFKLHKALGLHTVSLAATPAAAADGSSVITADVAVTGKVTVVDARASVESASSRDTQPLTFGQPVPETLSLSQEKTARVVITFTVQQGSGEGFAPHQAMVRAVHVGSGASAFIRAKSGDEGYHRAVIAASDVAIQAEERGGLYDLALLIGDAGIEAPIEWKLGQVEVAAAGSEVVAAPSLVTTSRRAEIHHVFRAPDRRTPAFISIFFSALQVAMLAVLAAALLRITGARLPGLPRSVGGWAAAVGFHGGLTSVLGLYLVFWVDLTILQMLPYLAVLGTGTAAFGFLLLSHLATAQVRAKSR